MVFYFLSRVPWDVYYNTEACACFFDLNGQCIDNPSFDNVEEYEKCFLSASKDSMLTNALVIYIATHPDKGQDVVVGWYKSATIYQKAHYHLHSDRVFTTSCDIENAYLLLPEKRNFVFSMKQQAFALADSNQKHKIAKYISQTSKDMFMDIKLSLNDDKLLKKATPQEIDDIIQQYRERKNRSLLPVIYGYAKEWSMREPKNAEPRERMGYALLELVRLDEALKCFDYALSLDRDHFYSLFGKGSCLMRLGRYYEAIFCYNHLLSLDDQNDNLRVILSYAYLVAGFASISYRLLKEITDPKIAEEIAPMIAERERALPFLRREHGDVRLPDAYPVTIPFNNEDLPESYTDSSGLERYLDPIRLKGIQITPEETVRQQVISYLLDKKGFPVESILVEESLSYIDKELRERVDILVHQRDIQRMHNLMVIECKAPHIPLDSGPTSQLLNYNNILCARFAVLTNGLYTHVFEFDNENNTYKALRDIPSYDDVIQKTQIKPVELKQIPWKRPKYEDLTCPKVLDNYAFEVIGEDTPPLLRPFVLNLYLCLVDESQRLPCPLSVPGCTVIKDYGVVPLTTGNAGGGSFYGNYRWFGVKDRHGKRQNLYLSIHANGRTVGDAHWGNRKGVSVLYVVIEEKGKPVSRLQLSLDSGLKPQQKGYRLTHSGVRSRRKIDSLISFMAKITPNLLGDSERVVLGWLSSEKNLILSDLQTAEVIANLLAYVMLRSELHWIESEKQRKNKKARL